MRQCEIDECSKPVRSSGATLCAMHYHRVYRHGDPQRSARSTIVSVSHGRKYRTVYRPTHPLASRWGKVYEHRAVLFDCLGPDAQACHWCGREVNWCAKPFTPAALEVDHLNGLGDDNRPENLVPSCPRCNRTRGAQARSGALREAGWWSSHDTISALSSGRARLLLEE